jgi:DNA-binding GntR family transcriptional regulator
LDSGLGVLGADTSRSIAVSEDIEGVTVMMTSDQSVCKVEAAYEKVKSLVLANQLHPNEHLQISNLADRLRVGVTPLREALIRLTAENLIESHPHRGFFAKVLTIGELNDLSQLAHLLLRSSLHGGSRRFGIEWSADVRGTEDSARSDQSAEAAVRAVEQLYERIVMASENATMLQAIRNYNSRVHAVLLIFVEQLKTPKIASDYVRAVTDLLVAGDQDAIARMLRHWFDTKAACFSKLIKEATAQAFSAQWSNDSLAPFRPVRTQNAGTSTVSATIARREIMFDARE